MPSSTLRQLEICQAEVLDVRHHHSACCTNLELPADAVWCLYRDGANAEKRIKELEYDFGVEAVALKLWGSDNCNGIPYEGFLTAYSNKSPGRYRKRLEPNG